MRKRDGGWPGENHRHVSISITNVDCNPTPAAATAVAVAAEAAVLSLRSNEAQPAKNARDCQGTSDKDKNVQRRNIDFLSQSREGAVRSKWSEHSK